METPIDKEQVIARIKETGLDNPDTIDLVRRWKIQQEDLIKDDFCEASIVLNIDMADLYEAGGNIDEALNCLEDARYQAGQVDHKEFYDQITKRMEEI